ncbi:MAG: hypothetical protein K8R90_08055 [Candidatus Cloacimonetes bacterium]|nr:hypothetical protein [Candidatus Cloacimonadota bacterium]
MKATLTITFVLLCASALAMFDDYEPSPRARAMGGAYTAVASDANTAFYNPAGLVFLQNEARLGYSHILDCDFIVLKTAALASILPRNFGTAAIAIQALDCDYLETNLDSEKIYRLAHGFTLLDDVYSQVHVGWSASLYHLAIHGFGDDTAFGLDFGALAVLHQRTRLGFSVTNINAPKVGVDSRHELPQRLSAGVAYEPYPGVLTTIELKKTFNTATESEDTITQYHAGCEVTLFERLFLRAGVRSQPSSYSMGMGLDVRGILIDYAYNTHQVLGGTHHFGMGYSF